ncbi:hypothetical protein MKX01_000804 [Papaver californicum]|nr:hypothetical protein MKX01_000804 [Papaver californicum]
MESTRGLSNGGSPTMLSLEVSGSTITEVVISEHGGGLQSARTTRESSQYHIEYIDRSRFNSLPSIIQLFLNSIREPSQGGYDSNNHKQHCGGEIIMQATWMDLEHRFRTWYITYNNMVMRSKARDAVEAMTEICIIDNDEAGGCPICHEEWKAGDDVRRTVCGHEYHSSCIETWLIRDNHGSCPICRSRIAWRCSNCSMTTSPPS